MSNSWSSLWSMRCEGSKPGGTEATCLASCIPITKSKKSHGEKSGTKGHHLLKQCHNPWKHGSRYFSWKLRLLLLTELTALGPAYSSLASLAWCHIPKAGLSEGLHTMMLILGRNRHCQQMTPTSCTFIAKVHQRDSAEFSSYSTVWNLVLTGEGFASVFLHFPASSCGWPLLMAPG